MSIPLRKSLYFAINLSLFPSLSLEVPKVMLMTPVHSVWQNMKVFTNGTVKS